MAIYTYEVKGRAADNQTWAVGGDIRLEQDGQFQSAVDTAMRKSFDALTHGRAVYGQPGVGCSGPYTITSLHVERKEN